MREEMGEEMACPRALERKKSATVNREVNNAIKRNAEYVSDNLEILVYD